MEGDTHHPKRVDGMPIGIDRATNLIHQTRIGIEPQFREGDGDIKKVRLLVESAAKMVENGLSNMQGFDLDIKLISRTFPFTGRNNNNLNE